MRIYKFCNKHNVEKYQLDTISAYIATYKQILLYEWL